MQKTLDNFLDVILATLDQSLRLLFRSDSLKKRPWFSRLWLAGLFVAGIGLWGIFFNWGAFPLNYKDWANVTGPRLALLQDAIKKNSLPLHTAKPDVPMSSITDRYLSIPDPVLSPQVLLLGFISINQFILVDVLLLYAAGFFGLLWFMRKFSLSLIAFSILFVLFNFNGNILAHYAIGHFSWGGYFLFPWLAALAFLLVEGERGWGWIAKMSLLLFAIILQGSFHQFVWCLIFIGFLALVRRAAFWTAVGGATFGVLVSMVRILPPALMYGKFSIVYKAGYQNLSDLWFSMVNTLELGAKVTVPMMAQAVQPWELTMYVSLIGAVFLLYFGIYRWLSREGGDNPYLRLAFPVFGMFLLSFDLIFKVLRRFPIPLLEGERVPARIISLTFVFVLLFAVIEFQRWLNQPHKNDLVVQLTSIGLLMVGGNDLWQNYRAWRISRVSTIYPQVSFNRLDYYIVNHSDPPYITAIALGTAISILSIAVVLFLAYWQRKHPSKRENLSKTIEDEKILG